MTESTMQYLIFILLLERKGLSFTAGGNIALLENNMYIPQINLEIELPYGLAKLFLGIYYRDPKTKFRKYICSLIFTPLYTCFGPVASLC